MKPAVFADDEGQSTLGWFFIASILLHAVFFGLWPQWKATFSSGSGFDQGGIVELINLPEHPQIMQPNLPPRPAPPVAERPSVEPTPTPAPEPVTQPQPTQPVPKPEPVSPPTPAPPTPKPAPLPEPEPEIEPGQDEDVLVSEGSDFEIASGAPIEREPAPQPEPPPVPVPRPDPDPVDDRTAEPDAESPREAGDGVEDGDGTVDAEIDGGDADVPAAAPPVSNIRGAALGSGKSLDDVGETDVLSALVVELHIGADGRVTDVIILNSSGEEDVDDAMVNQMRRWVSETPPGRVVVEVWQVTFELHAVGSTTQWQPVPEVLEVR